MDELARALRAVLEDPGQMQQLRAMADSLGLGIPDEETAHSAADSAQKQPDPPLPAPPSAPPMQQLPGGLMRQGSALEKKQQALLQALRPFLRRERQEKLDRALQAAQLASVAGLMLKNRRSAPGSKERL